MSDTLPILIVDDQPKLLRLVIELMTRLGFPEVDGVADGAEALIRLRERRYALVIPTSPWSRWTGCSCCARSGPTTP